MTHRKVFLSSTSKGLVDHRNAAYKALEGLDGHHCVRMEDFGARAMAADDFCRARVAECDLFLCVLGLAYGSKPEGKSESYTEREFQAAAAERKPILVFVAKEGCCAQEPVEDEENRRRQQVFRDLASKNRIRVTFCTPGELAVAVIQAVRNWEQSAVVSSTAHENIPKPPQPFYSNPYPLQENFTGRIAERRILMEWIAGNVNVMAVVALGGMGKSALSWVWLHLDVLDVSLAGATSDHASGRSGPEADRPEGVIWWSFSGRDTSFAPFIDAAFAYLIPATADRVTTLHDRLDGILRVIAQRRVLLVLDGFEQMLRLYSSAYPYDTSERNTDPQLHEFRSCSDPHAQRFLRSVASLPLRSRVLVTTRLLPSELDGLAGATQHELKGLARDDALLFFRSQGVQKATPSEIVAACEGYGYHPLSLRLLSGLIVKDKRLPGDITVTEHSSVTTDRIRQQQEAVLRLAYDALPEAERILLSSISAFRGPVGYDAVEALAAHSLPVLNDLLDELIERGFLLFDPERVLYDLHALVRNYAYIRLGNKPAVHKKLCAYFAQFPLPAEEEVTGLGDLTAAIELFHHQVGAGEYNAARNVIKGPLGRMLVYKLGAYFVHIDLLRRLLAERREDPPLLGDHRALSSTLNEMAISYTLCGLPRRALPLLAEYIERNRGNPHDLAVGDQHMGVNLMWLGMLKRAEDLITQGTQLAKEVRDSRFYPAGLREIGRLQAFLGRYEDSESSLTAAFDLFSGQQDTQWLAVTWADRALRYLLMDRPHEALRAAQESRQMACVRGYQIDIIRADWLTGLAITASGTVEDRKSMSEAEASLAEALVRCRRINLTFYEAHILLAWARWHHLVGARDLAESCAQEALEIAARCEYRLSQAEIYNWFAGFVRQAGDQERSRHWAKLGYDRAWCDGPPHCYFAELTRAQSFL